MPKYFAAAKLLVYIIQDNPSHTSFPFKVSKDSREGLSRRLVQVVERSIGALTKTAFLTTYLNIKMT